jgi:hypothetical protein
MSEIPDRLRALAADMASVADLLREDARRVDLVDGWAARAFVRYRHADELESAGRMIGSWAEEIAGD